MGSWFIDLFLMFLCPGVSSAKSHFVFSQLRFAIDQVTRPWVTLSFCLRLDLPLEAGSQGFHRSAVAVPNFTRTNIPDRPPIVAFPVSLVGGWRFSCHV